MNPGNASHQQQFQTFGEISAEGNARIVIEQISNTYQVIPREEVKERELIQASPYIGLKKFESRDKDLFFGREAWIARLVETVGTSNLILLLGASGSGKSSLVRAGLIPKLTELLRNTFVELVLTPDRNPFESFRSALMAKGYSQDATEAILQKQPSTLNKTVKALKKDAEQWLIFLDQFEQLFTRCKDTDLQKRFIDSMTQLVNDKKASVKVVLAMRADFLDKLSPYPELTKRQLFLHDMQPDELRLAIAQPAAQHGVVFEDDLVGEIISDVQGQARLQPGSLPLLQYTLDLLWQRSDISSRTLRIETYRARGKVRDALQKQVKDIYASLSQNEQAIAKQIFLKLVDIDRSTKESEATSRVISRRAYRSEFSSELAKKTLDKLVNNNLLVTSREQQATVELAHEILINSWSTLKGWIEESREAIILRNRLADDAQRWQALQKENKIKAEEELWSGSKLERVLELKQEKQFELQFGGLSPEQEQFFTASIEKRDHDRQKEAREKFLRRLGILLISLTVTVAIGAGIFAKHNQNTNKSLQLANASETNLTLDPTRSLWLAIAAHLIQDTPQAKLALWNALQANHERFHLVGHADKVLYAEFDPKDSQRVLTVSSDRTARVWNLNDPGNSIVLKGHKGTVKHGRFDPHNQNRVLTVSFDGNAYIWDLEKPSRPMIALEGHTQPINHGEFDPHNSNRVLTASSDDTARVWNLDNPDNPMILGGSKGHEGDVWVARFDPQNANRVLTASQDGTARVWELDKLEQPLVLQGHIGEVVDGIFDPKDSNRLLTVSSDKTARIWNLKEPDKPIILRGHSNTVWQGSFDPQNSNKILTVSSDGTARFWTLGTSQKSTILRGHQGEIFRGFFHPQDSNRVLTVSSDGTAKIWDISKSTSLITLYGHKGKISSGAFAPQDPDKIVTVGEDETARIWSLDNKTSIQIPNRQERSRYSTIDSAFSPDSSDRILTIGGNGIVKDWNLSNIEEVKTFPVKLVNLKEAWFSPKNSHQIAIVSYTGNFELWNLKNNRKPLKLPKGEAKIHKVRFDYNNQNRLLRINTNSTATVLDINRGISIELPLLSQISDGEFDPNNSNRVATSSVDGKVQIWNLQELTKPFKPSIEFSASQQNIWRVKFDPRDSNRLLTMGSDGIARVWDLNSLSIIAELSGHQAAVVEGSFDPNDSNRLLTVSHDKTARLWDLRIPNSPLIFRGHNDKVTYGSFDPKEANKFLTISSDGTTQVYNLDDEILLKIAWDNKSRCLSEREISNYNLSLNLIDSLSNKLSNSDRRNSPKSEQKENCTKTLNRE